MKLSDINMTLFFTGGIGLKTWVEVGNMDREIAVYKSLTEHINTVNFVSYEENEDEKYFHLLGEINCSSILWSRYTSINIIRLLLSHWKVLKASDILKTNQILGVRIPVLIKKMLGKKLIVRCGYLLSRVAVNSNGRVANINYARKLEKYAFKNADISVVTTEFNRRHVIEQYGIDPKKIVVIPNYVDTDLFKPKGNIEKEYDLIFVGRGGEEKNLYALLEALEALKENGQEVNLLLVGDCSSDKGLQDMARSRKLKVTFYGNVNNDHLPDLLNRGKALILPSFYEGHPKVLIEAMSCGMPCIGTEVEGIGELIENGETGYLCGTDAENIADAIEAVLSDEALRKKMGRNARCYAVENFSLERILVMELEMIKEVVSR